MEYIRIDTLFGLHVGHIDVYPIPILTTLTRRARWLSLKGSLRGWFYTLAVTFERPGEVVCPCCVHVFNTEPILVASLSLFSRCT